MKFASMLKPKAPHVLLVDDNQNGLLARKSLLEEQGLAITTATNGEEAFEAFSKGKFDLLVTDYRMPKLRSEEHTSELQSRLHLVCRLLLEKKKPKRDTPASSARARLSPRTS